MKHRKKDYGESKNQDSQEDQNEPEWFNNQRRRVGVRSKPKVEHGTVPRQRSLQRSGSDDQSQSGSESGSEQTTSDGRPVRIRRPKHGRASGEKTTKGNQTTRLGKLEITLRELRDSLVDEKLESLLDGSFNPHEMVTIKYTISGLSKLAEDSLRGPITRKRNPRIKKPPLPPSKKYGDMYNRFTRGELALDAGVVLGRYLLLYKKLYGEEDPEFVGTSTSHALHAINEMATLLTDGNFDQILGFIDKLMPMWAQQLRNGADFPTARPTFNTFFVKRKIWSQRYSLVRRWK